MMIFSGPGNRSSDEFSDCSDFQASENYPSISDYILKFSMRCFLDKARILVWKLQGFNSGSILAWKMLGFSERIVIEILFVIF